MVWYGILGFNVPLDTVVCVISETGAGALSSDVHLHSVMEASDIITPLTRVAFVYNGPKGMELAPNPRYSGGRKSSRRLI